MWRAVLIGVNNYEEATSFPPLKYALADITDLQSLIADPEIGEIEAINIVTLPDATDAVIRRQLDILLSNATVEDSVLIYFAGHGKTDRLGRLCLAAKDTKSDLLHGTGLPFDLAKMMLESSPAKRIVFVIDSCFSGAVGESLRGSDVPSGPFEEMSGEGKIIISSSREFQAARERDELGHGVFAHFFLEGLRSGEADQNNDGKIGIEELFEYVRKRMENEKFGQTPQKWGRDQTGEIYIAKSRRVLKQKLEERQRLENKKEKLVSWYVGERVPVSMYNRALPLLDLKAGEGTEKDRALLRLLEDGLAELMDLSVLVQTWGRVEKPDPREEARMAFRLAEEANTESAWQGYLERYGGADKGNDSAARERLDACRYSRGEGVAKEDAAYQRAQTENTPAAWNSFLQAFPRSPRKPEALQRLVSLSGGDRITAARTAFDRARRDDTPEAWSSYLEKWKGAVPEQDIAAEDRLRTFRSTADPEKLAYEVARQGGQSEDWLKFLQQFPDSPLRTEVLGRLATLLKPPPAEHMALRRAGADLIDYVLIVSIAALFVGLLVAINPFPTPVLIVESLIGAFVSVGLSYVYSISRAGRTFGHKIVGTSVVDKQREFLSGLRTLGYLGPWLIWWIPYWVVGVFTGNLLEWVTGNHDLVPVTGFLLVSLVGPVLGTAMCVRLTSSHRAPYDFLAGTLVVLAERSKAPSKALALSPGPWHRLAADAVDAGSLVLVGASVATFMGLLQAGSGEKQPNYLLELAARFGSLADALGRPYLLLLFAVLWLSYYVLFVRRFGQTLGSNILGFRLLRNDRGAPNWWNAARYASCLLITCISAFYLVSPPDWMPWRWLLALPLLIFLINPLHVHMKRHSLYDLAAGTQALRMQNQP